MITHKKSSTYIPGMNLLEVCRVAPADSAAELTLPLTFLDLFWFKLPPVERLFFYSVPGLDPNRFSDSVLPNLKHSLALTLVHYLPLAGNLLWPPSSPKPIVLYRPGDAVSLSVFESSADFDFLSGTHVRETAESRPLVPSLFISHAQASVIALSLTLFPNSGFCIGVSAHHAVLDGKSTTLFIKSWAHICKELVSGSADPNLPPELSPVYDRTTIEENPEARGVDMAYLRQWTTLTENLSEGNPRSLMIMQDMGDVGSNLVSGTFELTAGNIEKLRNRVMKTEHSVSRLSTFVLSSAYALFHHLRALVMSQPGEGKKEEKGVVVGFTADYRARLQPPAPANYIGNCVGSHPVEVEKSDLMYADGFVILAVKTSEAVRDMEKGVLRDAEDRISRVMEMVSKYRTVGIAGSTRLGVYRADFGWGRPEKVAVQSIERTGAISMAESRDGNGGVEIGVVLTKFQMEYFQASFVDGLNFS